MQLMAKLAQLSSSPIVPLLFFLSPPHSWWTSWPTLFFSHCTLSIFRHCCLQRKQCMKLVPEKNFQVTRCHTIYNQWISKETTSVCHDKTSACLSCQESLEKVQIFVEAVSTVIARAGAWYLQKERSS